MMMVGAATLSLQCRSPYWALFPLLLWSIVAAASPAQPLQPRQSATGVVPSYQCPGGDLTYAFYWYDYAELICLYSTVTCTYSLYDGMQQGSSTGCSQMAETVAPGTCEYVCATAASIGAVFLDEAIYYTTGKTDCSYDFGDCFYQDGQGTNSSPCPNPAPYSCSLSRRSSRRALGSVRRVIKPVAEVTSEGVDLEDAHQPW